MGTGLTAVKHKEILSDVHDDANNSLRTTITNAAVDINVSAFTDSIAIADEDGNKVTTTNVGGKESLDVNVTDITLSHTNDSVRLGDGITLFSSTTSGAKTALDVSVLGGISGTFSQAPSGETVTEYDTIPSLAIGSTTTLLSYTVIPSATRYLQKIYISGTQVATYVVKKGATTIIRTRMSPTQFSQTLDLATGSAFGVEFLTGNVLTVEVTNEGSAVGEFDATAQFMEV